MNGKDILERKVYLITAEHGYATGLIKMLRHLPAITVIPQPRSCLQRCFRESDLVTVVVAPDGTGHFPGKTLRQLGSLKAAVERGFTIPTLVTAFLKGRETRFIGIRQSLLATPSGQHQVLRAFTDAHLRDPATGKWLGPKEPKPSKQERYAKRREERRLEWLLP
jgi:hypothetical protein